VAHLERTGHYLTVKDNQVGTRALGGRGRAQLRRC